MDARECILKEEAEYPKLFSLYSEEEFGIMFYCEKNKELHESNHAILYPERINDLGRTLDIITKFYMNKNIKPTIFHPFIPNYFEDNKSIFKKNGYDVTINENYRFMILSEQNTIQLKNSLEIKRISEWDDRIANDIIIPCGEIWEIESTKVLIKNKNAYLFVGYVDDIAVTYTILHTSNNDCTRFDYILTSKHHRG